MNIEAEKNYLKRTLDVITESTNKIDEELSTLGDNILEGRAHVWDTVAEMDDYEQAATEGDVQLKADYYTTLAYKRSILEKQADSPYFGKIRFLADGEKNPEDYYFGIASLSDDNKLYVIDWRAPIADLYYNFELGRANYEAPAGVHSGDIAYKYQFKIEKGKIKYAIDSQATITDEVLMRELSKNASPLMKNIAATIQREQNDIIRISFGENLLVQGVAGSGKTSIALHRVAYILYNCRDTIKAKDILIISPSKAFSGYIRNVLPELGENNVVQLGLEEIANAELKGFVSFENRATYLERVYDSFHFDQQTEESMRYKSSIDFVVQMKKYMKYLEKSLFKPRNFKVKDYECTKETFEKLFFVQFKRYPARVRLNKIVGYVEEEMRAHFHHKINPQLHFKIMELLSVMFKRFSPVELYNEFLLSLQKSGKNVNIPDLTQPIPFEDVYGMVLFKISLEGAKGGYGKYKHVVVDEMQDYTPSQYEIVNMLFKCPKTVLGDMNQIIDPYMNIGSLENMQLLLGDHNLRLLTTSYRSSLEITEFANRLTTERVNPIARHEGQPEIIKCNGRKDVASRISENITDAYEKHGFGSVAIIARNKEHALALREDLAHLPVTLLLDSTTPYRGGTVITTAIIVKGFEFDRVIIPDADADCYSSDAEKHILYVSITRALHSLKIYYTTELSEFLK